MWMVYGCAFCDIKPITLGTVSTDRVATSFFGFLFLAGLRTLLTDLPVAQRLRKPVQTVLKLDCRPAANAQPDVTGQVIGTAG